MMPGLFSMSGEDKEKTSEVCDVPTRDWVEDFVLPFLAGAAGAVFVALATWALQRTRPGARRPAGIALSLSGAACCSYFRRTRPTAAMASDEPPEAIELHEAPGRTAAANEDLERGEPSLLVTAPATAHSPPTKTAPTTRTTTTVSTQTIGRRPTRDPFWQNRATRPPWFPPPKSPWSCPPPSTYSVATRLSSRSSSSAASATQSGASKSPSPEEEPALYTLFGEDSRSQDLQAWRDRLTGEGQISSELRRATSSGRSRPWASSSRVSLDSLSFFFSLSLLSV